MNPPIVGWHSDRPIFKRLLASVKPKIVFELGSWQGASMIHMVRTAKELGLDTRFYAIDYWSPDTVIQGGRCLFDQFMHNITVEGCADRVTPLHRFTAAAAVELNEQGVKAQLIYVDADHTYQGALDDMENYYPLLEPGGVMFGDDYTEIPDVRHAVQEFCHRHQLLYQNDYYHWELSPKAT